MKEILKINLDQIDPYVRVVQNVSGTDGDYYVPWRIIYDFEIMFIINGKFRIITTEKTINLTVGDIVIIPPFLKHKQEIPENSECTYYALHLDFFRSAHQDDFSYRDIYIQPCEDHSELGVESKELSERQMYAPDGLSLSVIVKIKDFNAFHDIFKKLYDSYQKNTDISHIETRAYALLLIASFFREVDKNQDETNYAEKIVETMANYMSRYFYENVNLVAFSQQYGFSPNYFRKIFKQILNCAPNEYLISVRLKEAKKLLELGQYTVQTVSEMVGYDDVHYFSRLFKKKEGISPAKYGEMYRKKGETVKI